MHELVLAGCSATPFGSYLKALAVLRLVSEQADSEARGSWSGDTFVLDTTLDKSRLVEFFVERYRPTSIVAPWNGGSGFYPKDNKEGIDAIAGSAEARFAEYRGVIEFCREIEEVRAGNKGEEEGERRVAILRKCRNGLPDSSVEWLDAAVAISADGSRPCAPVLGTGGNEGRLDYTNNFMSRIAALLIAAKSKTKVAELLGNAIFGTRTEALEKGAAGQYDPGRAGGPNQGSDVETDSVVNPWDLVLTLEGAVMWSSGLYRRQGAKCRSMLCSPFTVNASRVGYGSAAEGEDARAEIWAPLWVKPSGYAELRGMLREGRASVGGRPARNGLEFAEAASSLGVDRGIQRFVRYSLLKRRGDSYVALPAGVFPAKYRSESDLVRGFLAYYEELVSRPLPKRADALRRSVDSAVFNALLHGEKVRIRELMRAFGRLLRSIMMSSDNRPPLSLMPAADWIEACGCDFPEVRIAASLASLRHANGKRMLDFIARKSDDFAWSGLGLPDRMTAVLQRQMRLSASWEESGWKWYGYRTQPGDTTLFIEGSVDDEELEELLFAFSILDWRQVRGALGDDGTEVMAVYAASRVVMNSRPDSQLIALLKAADLSRAGQRAMYLLRVLGKNPRKVSFDGSTDSRRLAASLLIPVKETKPLRRAISMVLEEQENEEDGLAITE